MPNSELEKYIQNSRSNQIPDATIKQQLISSGWNEGDVNAALNPIAPTTNVIPTPPVPRFGMWVAFQYIILFISLYISASSLAGILHLAVDNLLKDPVSAATSTYDYSSIFTSWLLKAYLAALIVVFPIFAVLFVMLKRQIFKNPLVRNLGARKVLIYITLVGTFLLMIGHLIITLFGFLNGSASLNSISHFLVTLLIAGSIFIYLLFEVREDRRTK